MPRSPLLELVKFSRGNNVGFYIFFNEQPLKFRGSFGDGFKLFRQFFNKLWKFLSVSKGNTRSPYKFGIFQRTDGRLIGKSEIIRRWLCKKKIILKIKKKKKIVKNFLCKSFKTNIIITKFIKQNIHNFESS